LNEIHCISILRLYILSNHNFVLPFISIIYIIYVYIIDIYASPYDVFIPDVKGNYVEELSTFNKLIQEHTQKLSFLTLLIEEESKLQKLKQYVTSNVNYLILYNIR